MTKLYKVKLETISVSSSPKEEIIKAKTPLAELDRYSTSLLSITQGKGSYTSSFAEYSIVPNEIQKVLVKEYLEED